MGLGFGLISVIKDVVTIKAIDDAVTVRLYFLMACIIQRKLTTDYFGSILGHIYLFLIVTHTCTT